MLRIRRVRQILSTVILLIPLVAYSAVATAQPSGDCRLGEQPAATLLFPYFEVDLGDPNGRTTLISISSVSGEAALAHVVVWSDCGVPLLDFSLYLAAHAIQSIDLRAVIAGQLPVTGPPGDLEPPPGCTDPIALPILDQDAVTALQTRLAGQPDPQDGLCYGSYREGSRLAVGYLTVDVLNGCSETIRTPLDDGYFESGGRGLASNDNVLSGDFFFLDPVGDAAQGNTAVHLIADAEAFAGSKFESFYAREDQRLPLGSHYRSRFLAGGGFDGGTDLVFWHRGPSIFDFSGPRDCERSCYNWVVAAFRERDEAGVANDFFREGTPAFAFRWKVGSAELPVNTAFGSLDISFGEWCPICSPPYVGPVQAWVIPIHSGRGRFSVGLSALSRTDPCAP